MRTRQQSKLLDNNSASSSKSRNRNKSNDDNITEQSTSTEKHYNDVAPQLQLDIVNSDKEPIVTNCLPPTKTPGKHFKKKLIQQHAIEEEKVDPDLCDMSKTNPKRGKRNPKTNYNPPDMEYYKLGTDEREIKYTIKINRALLKSRLEKTIGSPTREDNNNQAEINEATKIENDFELPNSIDEHDSSVENASTSSSDITTSPEESREISEIKAETELPLNLKIIATNESKPVDATCDQNVSDDNMPRIKNNPINRNVPQQNMANCHNSQNNLPRTNPEGQQNELNRTNTNDTSLQNVEVAINNALPLIDLAVTPLLDTNMCNNTQTTNAIQNNLVGASTLHNDNSFQAIWSSDDTPNNDLNQNQNVSNVNNVTCMPNNHTLSTVPNNNEMLPQGYLIHSPQEIIPRLNFTIQNNESTEPNNNITYTVKGCKNVPIEINQNYYAPNVEPRLVRYQQNINQLPPNTNTNASNIPNLNDAAAAKMLLDLREQNDVRRERLFEQNANNAINNRGNNAVHNHANNAVYTHVNHAVPNHTDNVVHGHANHAVPNHAVYTHANHAVPNHTDNVVHSHANHAVPNHANHAVPNHTNNVVHSHANNAMNGHGSVINHTGNEMPLIVAKKQKQNSVREQRLVVSDSPTTGNALASGCTFPMTFHRRDLPPQYQQLTIDQYVRYVKQFKRQVGTGLDWVWRYMDDIMKFPCNDGSLIISKLNSFYSVCDDLQRPLPFLVASISHNLNDILLFWVRFYSLIPNINDEFLNKIPLELRIVACNKIIKTTIYKHPNIFHIHAECVNRMPNHNCLQPPETLPRHYLNEQNDMYMNRFYPPVLRMLHHHELFHPLLKPPYVPPNLLREEWCLVVQPYVENNPVVRRPRRTRQPPPTEPMYPVFINQAVVPVVPHYPGPYCTVRPVADLRALPPNVPNPVNLSNITEISSTQNFANTTPNQTEILMQPVNTYNEVGSNLFSPISTVSISDDSEPEQESNQNQIAPEISNPDTTSEPPCQPTPVIANNAKSCTTQDEGIQTDSQMFITNDAQTIITPISPSLPTTQNEKPNVGDQPLKVDDGTKVDGHPTSLFQCKEKVNEEKTVVPAVQDSTSENENAQRRNIENRAFARRDRTKKILDTIKKRKSLIKQKKRLKCDGCHKKKPPLKCKNFSCSNKSEKCDFHKLQLCNRSRVPYQNLFNLNQLYSRPMNNCIYENTVNTFINTVHSFVRDGRNDGPHGMTNKKMEENFEDGCIYETIFQHLKDTYDTQIFNEVEDTIKFINQSNIEQLNNNGVPFHVIQLYACSHPTTKKKSNSRSSKRKGKKIKLDSNLEEILRKILQFKGLIIILPNEAESKFDQNPIETDNENPNDINISCNSSQHGNLSNEPKEANLVVETETEIIANSSSNQNSNGTSNITHVMDAIFKLTLLAKSSSINDGNVLQKIYDTVCNFNAIFPNSDISNPEKTTMYFENGTAQNLINLEQNSESDRTQEDLSHSFILEGVETSEIKAFVETYADLINNTDDVSSILNQDESISLDGSYHIAYGNDIVMDESSLNSYAKITELVNDPSSDADLFKKRYRNNSLHLLCKKCKIDEEETVEIPPVNTLSSASNSEIILPENLQCYLANGIVTNILIDVNSLPEIVENSPIEVSVKENVAFETSISNMERPPDDRSRETFNNEDVHMRQSHLFKNHESVNAFSMSNELKNNNIIIRKNNTLINPCSNKESIALHDEEISKVTISMNGETIAIPNTTSEVNNKNQCDAKKGVTILSDICIKLPEEDTSVNKTTKRMKLRSDANKEIQSSNNHDDRKVSSETSNKSDDCIKQDINDILPAVTCLINPSNLGENGQYTQNINFFNIKEIKMPHNLNETKPKFTPSVSCTNIASNYMKENIPSSATNYKKNALRFTRKRRRRYEMQATNIKYNFVRTT